MGNFHEFSQSCQSYKKTILRNTKSRKCKNKTETVCTWGGGGRQKKKENGREKGKIERRYRILKIEMRQRAGEREKRQTEDIRER
jgi:hypothetical protein